MEFKSREPTTGNSLREWEAGPYVVAELAYAFGQHRIQIWHKLPHFGCPDVVPPNF